MHLLLPKSAKTCLGFTSKSGFYLWTIVEFGGEKVCHKNASISHFIAFGSFIHTITYRKSSAVDILMRSYLAFDTSFKVRIILVANIKVAYTYLLMLQVPVRTVRQLFDRSKGFHMLCGWTLALATGKHFKLNRNYQNYFITQNCLYPSFGKVVFTKTFFTLLTVCLIHRTNFYIS